MSKYPVIVFALLLSFTGAASAKGFKLNMKFDKLTERKPSSVSEDVLDRIFVIRADWDGGQEIAMGAKGGYRLWCDTSLISSRVTGKLLFYPNLTVAQMQTNPSQFLVDLTESYNIGNLSFPTKQKCFEAHEAVQSVSETNKIKISIVGENFTMTSVH